MEGTEYYSDESASSTSASRRSDSDSDGEEAPWMGLDASPPRPSDRECLEAFKAAKAAKANAVAEKMGSEAERVVGFLSELEPRWTAPAREPPAAVLRRMLVNLGLLDADGAAVLPDPASIGRAHDDLLRTEMDIKRAIASGVAQELNVRFYDRCRRLEKMTYHAREALAHISSYMMWAIPRSPYDDLWQRNASAPPLASASHEAPLLEPTPPAGLSAQAIREARAAFDAFTASVGNRANGHGDGWARKAVAVARLEAYVRETFAVYPDAFRLYDTASNGLTDHDIWWIVDADEQIRRIPWTKLLRRAGGSDQGLGVIASKTRQQMVCVLRRLVDKSLYP
jgi:hypothetical protein